MGASIRRFAASSLLLMFAGGAALAQPITLVSNTLNMFRDTRGANDVGIGQGDRFQFGADIVGGSAGVSLGATYGPTGFTVSQFACNPLAVNANFCSRTTAFDANKIDPWTIRFTRGADTASARSASPASRPRPTSTRPMRRRSSPD